MCTKKPKKRDQEAEKEVLPQKQPDIEGFQNQKKKKSVNFFVKKCFFNFMPTTPGINNPRYH